MSHLPTAYISITTDLQFVISQMNNHPNHMPKLYLASQSPRRSQLLTQMGLQHQILAPDDIDSAEKLEELEIPLPKELPLNYVERVTLLKMQSAIRRHSRQKYNTYNNEKPFQLLCADTTVAHQNVIYGKPIDETDAIVILTKLQGQTHQVHTCVAVYDSRQQEIKQLIQTSNVTFCPLNAQKITNYVATGEPIGKAGAYGIQGQAGAFIVKLEGSYSGVMGLPMFETALLLQPKL